MPQLVKLSRELSTHIPDLPKSRSCFAICHKGGRACLR